MQRFIIAFFMVCFLFITVTLVHAQNRYEVVPVILIPKDWQEKIPEDKLQRYRGNTLTGLSGTQALFKRKIGKTFNYSEHVKVIQIDTTLEEALKSEVEPPANAGELFFRLKGDQYLSEEPGKIYAIWIIGISNINAGAVASGSYAVFGHDELLMLGPDNFGIFREKLIDRSIRIIAHELGHTFGLAFSGWAKGHTCSQYSQHQCRSEAPEPLPTDAEAYFDIMHWKINDVSINDVVFSNTVYNPEIYELYQSPFINPENDPAPIPISETNQALVPETDPRSYTQPFTTLVYDFVVICGPEFKPLKGVEVSLFSKSSPSQKLTSNISDLEGRGGIEFTHFNPRAGEEFEIRGAKVAGQEQNRPPVTITIPASGVLTGSSSTIGYDTCPSMNIVGTESLLEGDVLSKVYISNYEDFREDNVPGDIGSKTRLIDNPTDRSQIDWTLSSVNKLKEVYIREIYANEVIKDYTAQLDENKMTRVGNIEIIGKRKRNITNLSINEQGVNLGTFEPVRISMTSANRTARVKVTYSDGEEHFFALQFQDLPHVNPTPVVIGTPISCTNETIGQSLETECAGSCGKCPSGEGLVNVYGCSASNQGPISYYQGQRCSTKCAERCTNTSSPTPRPALSSQDPAFPDKMEATCDNSGLRFRLKQIDPNAKGYLLRVDKDPDSWSGSYSVNAGDFIFDRLNNGNYGDGWVLNYGLSSQAGAAYKWWVHARYDDGSYESGGMDGMYKGRFGSRIEGGIVVCQ